MSTSYNGEARRILAQKGVGMSRQDSRISFNTWQEYRDTLGLAAALEQEISEREETEPFTTRLVLIEHEKNNSHQYIAIFTTPLRRRSKLSVGDLASAFLSSSQGLPITDNESTEYDSSSEGSTYSSSTSRRKRARGRWDVRILLPIPWSGAGIVTALIERRWDAKHERYLDAQTVPTIPRSRFKQIKGRGTSAILRQLLAETKLSAKIMPQARHSVFCYVFQGLSELGRKRRPMAQDVATLLLGRKQDEVRKYDIYESLRNSSLASEDNMNLNDSQKAAIRLGRAAPAGFVICHGGPGTGKTHFVVQAVTPFLLDWTRKHHLLLTSAGNRGADSMANGLHLQLQRLIADNNTRPNVYVIRLHSIKTERAIALLDAERDRKGGLLKQQKEEKERKELLRSSNPTEPGQSEPSGEESNAILAHCETHAACKFEDVADERVQSLELSLGRRMLQIAGLQPGGPPMIDLPSFTDFKDGYERYRNGDRFSKEEWADFEDAIDGLMEYTISNATVVCATAAGAADSFFTSNYQEAELIVVDEAARLPEYQWWPLLGLYPKATGKIMVGDPNQLRPEAEERYELSNPYQEQIGISLQERLQATGFKSAFFTVQYRAAPEIAAIYNNVCYEGRLMNDDSTLVTARPLGQDIINHNQQTYGISTPVILYNAPNPEEQFSGSGSKYCSQYAILVLKILEDLLVAGFGSDIKPCSIAILTPYREQERILRICKAMMSRKYSTASEVILETAGKVQGMEYDIVIIDPVAVSKPGFLDKNRLNVLFSRARYGLYVVGHYRSWMEMWRSGTLPFQKFAKELKKYQVSWPEDQELASQFFDPGLIEA